MQRGARTRISDRPTLDAESTELATALTSGMPTRPISQTKGVDEHNCFVRQPSSRTLSALHCELRALSRHLSARTFRQQREHWHRGSHETSNGLAYCEAPAYNLAMLIEQRDSMSRGRSERGHCHQLDFLAEFLRIKSCWSADLTRPQ